MHLFHVLGVVAGETEDTLTTYFTMACPRLFIGAKTDWPKIEAEGRERGGPASPPPHQLRGLWSAVSSLTGFEAEPYRPKVFYYFSTQDGLS